MDHCIFFRFIIFAWSNALDTSLFFQARSIPMFFLCSTPDFLCLVSDVLYRVLGNMECNLRIAAKSVLSAEGEISLLLEASTKDIKCLSLIFLKFFEPYSTAKCLQKDLTPSRYLSFPRCPW